MKLYYYPGACSLAPHIVLCELGCAFEIERTDIASKTTASGSDFLAINPKGYVPALALDDGDVLTEAAPMLLYLADLSPTAGLAPPIASRERLRLMEWLNFVTAELHKTIGPFFKPDFTDAMREVSMRGLGVRLDFLDRHLSGRPYLLGDAYGVADAYAFVILNWSSYLDIDLDPWPAVRAYQARVSGRQAVKAAMRAEGLLGGA